MTNKMFKSGFVLLLCTILLLVNVMSVSAVTPSYLQTDIKAYYTLDENTGTTAGDNTPNNFGASIVGPSWTSGVINSGLFFDGTSDKVTLPLSLHNDGLKGSGKFIISMWIERNAVNDGMLFYGRTTSNNAGYDLFIIGNKLRVGGRSQTGDTFQSVTGSATLSSYTRYHIVAVYDYSGDRLISYINNIKDADVGVNFGSSVVNFDANVLDLGVLQTGNWYSGIMDEISFFDATNWTTQEIEDAVDFLYDLGNPDGLQQYPFEPLPFEVTSNTYNSTQLQNFNITLEGVGTFSTTKGTIITNISQGTGLYNISISSVSSDTYIQETFLNYNVSNNLLFNYSVYDIHAQSLSSGVFINIFNVTLGNNTFTLNQNTIDGDTRFILSPATYDVSISASNFNVLNVSKVVPLGFSSFTGQLITATTGVTGGTINIDLSGIEEQMEENNRNFMFMVFFISAFVLWGFAYVQKLPIIKVVVGIGFLGFAFIIINTFSGFMFLGMLYVLIGLVVFLDGVLS